MVLFAALSLPGCLTSPAEYKELLAAAKDHDGDGFVNVRYDGDDCDDDRADVNPGAAEVCDGADNNCDGETDEGFVTDWYEDHDSDGHTASAPVTACEAPSPEAENSPGLDCDDLDASVSPDAEEVCDGKDNNCDGRLDEQEASDAGLWYRDEDGDGFGQDEAPIRSCEALPSTVAQAGDCDDGDAAVSPGATEICDDGQDNNCDESASPCAFSGDYDLNDAEVIFTGEAGDEAGWAMCGGDLNHDGADDLAIGAPGADRVYVVYGPLTPGEHKLSDADLRISGASGSELGYALLCTDLNDDGGADLAVGAPGDSEVTLWFGPLGVGKKASTAADNTFSSSSDRYGVSLAGGLDDGEDSNRDADLFVGVAEDHNSGELGSLSVIWGPLESAKYTYSLALGEAERLAEAIVAVPDTNGDGIDELLVGEPGYDGLEGRLMHLPGETSRWDTVEGQATWSWSDSSSSGPEELGTALHVADINGDGISDFIASAPSPISAFAMRDGVVYVLPVKSRGVAEEERAVITLAPDIQYATDFGASDYDLDGDQDLLIACYGFDDGAAYILSGPFDTDMDYTEHFASFSDKLGTAILSTEAELDLSGDQVVDVALGANDPYDTSSEGAVYVFIAPGL